MNLKMDRGKKKYPEIVVVVDDDIRTIRSIRTVLKKIAKVSGFTSVNDALKFLDKSCAAVVITDHRMPGIKGTDFLAEVREKCPESIRFLLTGYADLDAMIEAINLSQVHRYISKPWDNEELCHEVMVGIEAYRKEQSKTKQIIGIMRRNRKLEQENQKLRNLLVGSESLNEIVTKDGKMLSVIDKIKQSAMGEAPILIVGETGTGKELVARFAHKIRYGSQGPFVAVNCGSLQEELIENELFGHEIGAYTGATKAFPGAFERASGGSIFLDEVAELKTSLQSRLLRVLEEGTVRRIGGKEDIPCDASILAATNRPLQDLITQGKFRRDLYYRINVFEFHLPPLRQRRQDIPLLANHFLRHFRIIYQRPNLNLTATGMEFLMELDFPGNIRELKNILERVVVIGDGVDAISEKELALVSQTREPHEAQHDDTSLRSKAIELANSLLNGEGACPQNVHLKGVHDHVKREVDRLFLKHWNKVCEGDVSKMAKKTSISRSHLYRMAKNCEVSIGGQSSLQEEECIQGAQDSDQREPVSMQ